MIKLLVVWLFQLKWFAKPVFAIRDQFYSFSWVGVVVFPSPHVGHPFKFLRRFVSEHRFLSLWREKTKMFLFLPLRKEKYKIRTYLVAMTSPLQLIVHHLTLLIFQSWMFLIFRLLLESVIWRFELGKIKITNIGIFEVFCESSIVVPF